MYTEALAGEAPAGPDREEGARRRATGNARRLLLLQTTLRLIADEGIDAVSHRSVADAAGVPLGSTTYWFSSRQEMLREALEHFARLEIETLREHLGEILGKRLSRRRLVDEFTALLLPQLGEERWRTVAQYAFMQEAARQPELEAVCREWSAAWEEALSELFESLGAEDPQLEARMFLAMLDGLLLGQLAAPDDDVEATVLRPALRAWFDRVPNRS
jgi:DNA-binding transcriptional regulator YbjK